MVSIHDVGVMAYRDCTRSLCCVHQPQITWLGLKAFQTMMTKKQAMYKDSLKMLAKALRNAAFLRLPKTCQEAVDMKHSADFVSIVF